jgi:hypothetical protein
VPVLKAKAGQCALGTPLGGAREQLIKVFRAQVQDVSAVGAGGFFCHGISKKRKSPHRSEPGGRKVDKKIDEQLP